MSGFHELALIEEIRRQVAADPRLLIAPGDDAALLRCDGSRGVLITIDTLMEGVHFDLSRATPEQIGRKALAVNLSDIAAMAGRPSAAVVGLSLPRARGGDFARRLMQGLQRLADQSDVILAGGDTNVWDGPAVVSVTLLGEPTGSGPVRRSGAQPGDWLMVTGPLGGSLQERHLTFTPRIGEAQELHQRVSLHAMIDISDGLATDLRHLMHESHVGALIEAATIPIHDDVDTSLSAAERLRHALTDGEDFELLIAVSPEDGRRLMESPSAGVQLFKIGALAEKAQGLQMLSDGEAHELCWSGWEHTFEDEGVQPSD